MIDIGLGSAAAKLTDKILGYNNDDVVDIMSDIATEYGLAHIAHVRLSSKKSNESTLLASFTTYSREWPQLSPHFFEGQNATEGSRFPATTLVLRVLKCEFGAPDCGERGRAMLNVGP